MLTEPDTSRCGTKPSSLPEKATATRKVKEVIHIRLNPNNINRDSGAEIPEAWMSAKRKDLNQRRTKNQRMPEETMVHGNNSRIEMHQSQQTTMIYNAVPQREEDLHWVVETLRSTSSDLVARQQNKLIILSNYHNEQQPRLISNNKNRFYANDLPAEGTSYPAYI